MSRPCTHGMSNTRTYRTWNSMRERCYNHRKDNFMSYGGRGIEVCDRWLFSFEAFLDDMGIRPENTTLERKNVNGDYTPENCKWASNKEQGNNRRTNRIITALGKSQTVSQWADETGLPVMTLHRRLEYGWSHERAVTTPRRAYPERIKNNRIKQAKGVTE